MPYYSKIHKKTALVIRHTLRGAVSTLTFDKSARERQKQKFPGFNKTGGGVTVQKMVTIASEVSEIWPTQDGLASFCANTLS